MPDKENKSEFSFQVITPKGMVEDATVSIATFPGEAGEFGVLPGHTPFLTTLKPGIINYESGGVPQKLSVSGGFVEVTSERVIVLARTSERPGEIDRERAERAKEAASSKLGELTQEDGDRKYFEAKLMRSLGRLEISTKR